MWWLRKSASALARLRASSYPARVSRGGGDDVPAVRPPTRRRTFDARSRGLGGGGRSAELRAVGARRRLRGRCGAHLSVNSGVERHREKERVREREGEDAAVGTPLCPGELFSFSLFFFSFFFYLIEEKKLSMHFLKTK